MRLNTKSIKFKIIFYITLFVVVAGVASNLFIYHYLNKIILDKTRGIDQIYVNNLQAQLDSNLQEILNLGILCANDLDVADGLSRNQPDTPKAGMAALRVQKTLNTYLHSSTKELYIRRLIAFNENGFSVHANTPAYGSVTDVQDIMNTPIFKQHNDPLKSHFSSVCQSIAKSDGDCMAVIFPISNPGVADSKSYLYIEADMKAITDVLDPYAGLNDVFVTTADGKSVISPKPERHSLKDVTDVKTHKPNSTVKYGGSTYEIYAKKLSSAGMTLYDCVNISSLELDSQKIFYTVFIVILTSVAAAFGMLVIISNYITRPISKLIRRIKKITQNDFSFDPDIEGSEDEIGEIGIVVNEMCGSIQSLLNETVENSENQKNIEIALLQSQVNPHFLYNTLDSIHWMAVVQKNPGICNITRSLTNLLKNMAKGFSSKIPLAEELSLLNDYTTIQSIRYLETFEVVNKIDPRFHSYLIIKMTLQPIVENAIFHGIEPKGTCGTITLEARDDEEFLYLTVRDDGVGMTQEEIHKLMASKKQVTRDTMNGIGMANVDTRLKLIYGKECGLSIESAKGEYTKVTVKIRKEGAESNVQNPFGG